MFLTNVFLLLTRGGHWIKELCRHIIHDQKAFINTSMYSNILQPLLLTPAVNVIRLNKKVTQVGKYFLGQVAIHVGNLHLYSQALTPRLSVEVKEEGPTLKLYKRAAPLLSGIEQIMNLIVTIGSYPIEPVSKK